MVYPPLMPSYSSLRIRARIRIRIRIKVRIRVRCFVVTGGHKGVL